MGSFLLPNVASLVIISLVFTDALCSYSTLLTQVSLFGFASRLLVRAISSPFFHVIFCRSFPVSSSTLTVGRYIFSKVFPVGVWPGLGWCFCPVLRRREFSPYGVLSHSDLVLASLCSEVLLVGVDLRGDNLLESLLPCPPPKRAFLSHYSVPLCHLFIFFKAF